MPRTPVRLALVGAAAAIAALSFAPAASAAPSDSSKTTVTFCHSTNSAENPFVTTTLDVSGVYTRHLGVKHQDGKDVIPPFEYNGGTYSQNWDAAGRAILAADCKVEGGYEIPADGNGLGATLVVLGSLPVAAGIALAARRRRDS